MSKNIFGQTALLVTAAVACGIAYLYRSDIVDVFEENQSPEMQRLVRLSRALRVLSDRVALLENKDPSVADGDKRFRALCEADADVDFIYENLDGVNGNETVKRKRKNLVEVTKSIAIRIDALKNDNNR